MAKKVDANQKAIVAAMRRMGATVLHLHTIGKGCPDIAVGYRKKNFLFEIKDGSNVPSKRKLTPDEIEFHESWRGQVTVIESVDDAINILNNFT